MTTPARTDDDRARIKRGAAISSVGVNIGLLGFKVAVGLITGSIALWASAADSFLDLTASVFAYLGVRIGSRPPDDTHAYGHEKFESLSSLVQLGALFLTVGLIAAEALQRLGNAEAVDTAWLGVLVIVVSLLVDIWIARRLTKAAADSGGSQALEADALHFTTDIWSNIAVLFGLIAAGNGYPEADPIAALLVAAFVAVTAIGLLRRTAGVLTDRAPDEETIRRMVGVIHSFPEVHEHHTLRARLVGSRIFLDVCVELDAELTFHRAHDITHEMQDALRVAVPDIADAVIHFEPADHPSHQDDAHHAHGFDALAIERDRD